MTSHSFSDCNISVVTRQTPKKGTHKYVVFPIVDIIHLVGLVKYSQNAIKSYKVVWPHANFFEKLNGRNAGSLGCIYKRLPH